VDVGPHARRVDEGAGADEDDLGPPVLAIQGHLARRAAVDALHAPFVARDVDRHRLARQQLDAIGLDQQVDHEGAARLPLAVQAVAAMREQRLRGEAVANRPARARAVQPVGHRSTITVDATSESRGWRRRIAKIGLAQAETS